MQNSITSWTPLSIIPNTKKWIAPIPAGDEISEVSSSGKLFAYKHNDLFICVIVADSGGRYLSNTWAWAWTCEKPCYIPGRLVHVSCMRASKQAKDKTGRYKACSVLLLGMSRDRRTPCGMWHVHTHMYTCWLHTYFASLGDKVTVMANGRARIFFCVFCGTYMFPCPRLRRQYRVGL